MQASVPSSAATSWDLMFPFTTAAKLSVTCALTAALPVQGC